MTLADPPPESDNYHFFFNFFFEAFPKLFHFLEFLKYFFNFSLQFMSNGIDQFGLRLSTHLYQVIFLNLLNLNDGVNFGNHLPFSI